MAPAEPGFTPTSEPLWRNCDWSAAVGVFTGSRRPKRCKLDHGRVRARTFPSFLPKGLESTFRLAAGMPYMLISTQIRLVRMLRLQRKEKKDKRAPVGLSRATQRRFDHRSWKPRVVRGHRPVIGLPEKSAYVDVVCFFWHVVLNSNHMLPHCRPLGAHVRNAGV